MKRGKLILGIIVLAAAAAAFGIACRRVRAQRPDPPSQMEPLKAARLHAAWAEVRRLNEEMAPFLQQIATICEESQINPALLGRTVSVEWETGKINRAVQSESKMVMPSPPGEKPPEQKK